MIGRLTGTATPYGSSTLIIDVAGVGYKVHVPLRIVGQAPASGPMTLHVHTYVREDALELYGFESSSALSLFELLLSVSGVGPKTALLVMDRGVEEVVKAVLDGDVGFFTTIPRLGKKNAQKIIIELKNKLGSSKDLDLSAEDDSETKQLTQALLSMGFAKNEIAEALKKVEPAHTTMEQKMRRALQLIHNS